MRAKFHLNSIENFGGQEQLKFMAVSAKFGPNGESEDNTYARYTPSAELKMTVTNPELLGKFKPGQKFYVDFVETE